MLDIFFYRHLTNHQNYLHHSYNIDHCHLQVLNLFILATLNFIQLHIYSVQPLKKDILNNLIIFL